MSRRVIVNEGGRDSRNNVMSMQGREKVYGRQNMKNRWGKRKRNERNGT